MRAQLQVELRALRKLRYVAVAYFAAHVGGASLLLALYNAWARDEGRVAAAISARGVSPWFAGFFLSVRPPYTCTRHCGRRMHA